MILKFLDQKYRIEAFANILKLLVSNGVPQQTLWQASHYNITVEHQAGDKLPFLDCSVCRVGDRFQCSVYWKPTFPGLGMSFFSYCTFRLNWTVFGLWCLVYKVCTSYILLHNELCFLKVFFRNNGFNTWFVEKEIKKFLNKQYNPSCSDAPDSSILNFFFGITLLWTILPKTSFWTDGFIR